MSAPFDEIMKRISGLPEDEQASLIKMLISQLSLIESQSKKHSSEPRQNFSSFINKATLGKEVVGIQQQNKVVAYVVPPEFIELIEDYEDRLAVENAKNEESESWEKVRQELGLVTSPLPSRK